MTLRILLLDDHQMLVEALAARLAAEPDLVVSTCASGSVDEAVTHAVRWRPDVVVLEVAPLDDRRRSLVTRLAERLGGARLVVLSSDDDPETAAEAATLGVDGWISKEAAADEVVELIRDAGRGRAWFPPRQLGAVLARLRGRTTPHAAGPLDALTDREREVLAAMVAGRPAAAVASRLRVSANTVRSHVSSIYDKLGVHSRLEAVAVARAAGMTGESPGATVVPLAGGRPPARSGTRSAGPSSLRAPGPPSAPASPSSSSRSTVLAGGR